MMTLSQAKPYEMSGVEQKISTDQIINNTRTAIDANVERIKSIHLGSLLEKSENEILQVMQHEKLVKIEELKKKTDQIDLVLIGRPIMVSEGPKVGGGGYSYYYSSIPQLVATVKRLIFRLSVYKNSQLQDFFPIVENIDLAVLKVLNKIWIDMNPENQTRDWEKIEKGFLLTSLFLDQINNRNLSSPQTFYIFKTIIQIIQSEINGQVDVEKSNFLANLILYNVGSCGFSGDLEARKNECQKFYKLPAGASLVQRRAIENRYEVQTVNHQIIEINGKLWAFVPQTFLAYQGQKAEKLCSDLKLLEKFNVKWELPSNSESEDYLSNYEQMRQKIYLHHDPIFSKSNGTVCWSGSEKCINLVGNSVLGTGAAVYLTWGFPPAMILLAVTNPLGSGFRGLVNQKVNVACVADLNLTKSNRHSFQADEKFVINPDEIPNLSLVRLTDENINTAKIENFWTNTIKKFEYIIQSWDQQDIERIERISKKSALKSSEQLIEFMKFSIFKTPALLKNKYRQNPSGIFEPLLLDYVKSEDVPVELKEKFPHGYVYPVRAFLNKFNKSHFTTSDEWEFAQVLFHEIAHLLNIGLDDDSEADQFAKTILWSISRYWGNCGNTQNYLGHKLNCVLNEKNRDLNFTRNWDIVYQRYDRIDWFQWDFKQIHFNKNSKLLWGFKELVNLSSLGVFEKSNFCKNFRDQNNKNIKWRIPTREEVQRDIWNEYQGLIDIFDGIQGPNTRDVSSPPNCLFDPDRNIMCKDPEQNKTTFFFRDKFGGSQNYPLVCVAETEQ